MFQVKVMLAKALKAVLVAVVAGALAAVSSDSVAAAFKEIPLVGAAILGALVAAVESLRNYLKVKLGWPL